MTIAAVFNFFWIFLVTDLSPSVAYDGKCDMFLMLEASDSGFIYSPNFPFNYFNAPPTRQRQMCSYNFFPGQKLLSGQFTAQICFVFHRFNIEWSEGCAHDYLMFPGRVKYCGNGTAASTSLTSLNSVFQTNFCWQTSDYLEVEFSVDKFNNGTGFFSAYEVTYFPTPSSNNGQELSNITTNDENMRIKRSLLPKAPCRSSEFTCFNRDCIPQEQVCNNDLDCPDDSDEQYYHARCAGLTQNIVACDFEGIGPFSWCLFNPIHWQIGKRDIYSSFYDHTFQVFDVGHFVYTLKHNTTLTYPFKNHLSTEARCMTFWYHMGSQQSELKVFIDPGKSATSYGRGPAWIRSQLYSSDWHLGKVQIPEGMSILKVIFVGGSVTKAGTSVALDDISIHNGACFQTDDVSCNFELDFCGWTNFDNGSSATFIIHSGAKNDRSEILGPTASYDRSIFHNYALFTYNQNLTKFQYHSSVLTSPVYTNAISSKSMCLLFYYYIKGHSVNSLEVSLRLFNGSLYNVWEMPADSSVSEWIVISKDISTYGPYQVVINATIWKGNLEAMIAVDNVQLIDVPCARATGSSTTLQPNGTTATPPKCSPGGFVCDGTFCISQKWRCDGHSDCHDQTDELNCYSEADKSLANGAIAGLCVGVIGTMAVLIIGIVVICHQRKKLKRRARERQSSHTVAYFPYGEGIHFDDGLSGNPNLPPPYMIGAIDRAFLGPSVQLPKYDLVASQPPAYNQHKALPCVYSNPLESESDLSTTMSNVHIPNAPLSGMGDGTISVLLFNKHKDVPPAYDFDSPVHEGTAESPLQQGPMSPSRRMFNSVMAQPGLDLDHLHHLRQPARRSRRRRSAERRRARQSRPGPRSHSVGRITPSEEESSTRPPAVTDFALTRPLTYSESNVGGMAARPLSFCNLAADISENSPVQPSTEPSQPNDSIEMTPNRPAPQNNTTANIPPAASRPTSLHRTEEAERVASYLKRPQQIGSVIEYDDVQCGAPSRETRQDSYKIKFGPGQPNGESSI